VAPPAGIVFFKYRSQLLRYSYLLLHRNLLFLFFFNIFINSMSVTVYSATTLKKCSSGYYGPTSLPPGKKSPWYQFDRMFGLSWWREGKFLPVPDIEARSPSCSIHFTDWNSNDQVTITYSTQRL